MIFLRLRFLTKRPLLSALILSGIVHLCVFAALRMPEEKALDQEVQPPIVLDLQTDTPSVATSAPQPPPEPQEMQEPTPVSSPPALAERKSAPTASSVAPAAKAAPAAVTAAVALAPLEEPLDRFQLADLKVGMHSATRLKHASLELDDSDIALSNAKLADAILSSTTEPVHNPDRGLFGGISITAGSCSSGRVR